MEGLNKYVPIYPTMEGLSPPSPGVEVTSLAPDGARTVSKIRCLPVGDIYRRAKPPPVRATPKHEGNALQPRRESLGRAFPKRKF